MWLTAFAALLACVAASAGPAQDPDDANRSAAPAPREQYDDPPAPPRPRRTSPPLPPPALRVGSFQSVQVNVDEDGSNIVGDAANEPSIAIHPLQPDRLVIAWRQFDSINSNFREAGYGYSTDAGHAWTAVELTPGTFRSDPVLQCDRNGRVFFYSLTIEGDYVCDLFTSADVGQTWSDPLRAYGGDKAWFNVDRTAGPGANNLYFAWDYAGCCGDRAFMRSTDGGRTFTDPIEIPQFPIWGTVAVGTDGAVYIAGRADASYSRFYVARSTNAQDADQLPAFDLASEVNLDGRMRYWIGSGPNPGGLVGQVWVACDHSDGPHRGRLYVLCSVTPFADDDNLDVMIAWSDDRAQTWEAPVRINDDARGAAWQWFGTLDVAPSGRLDAVWFDTRHSDNERISELFYAYSTDGGATWSPNVQAGPAFDSWLGWPRQEKLGDYIHGISDAAGMNLAYAATYNGEQDVYFVRIAPDCNGNGLHDGDDIASGLSRDANGNGTPDECEIDCGAILKFRVSCRDGTLRAKVRSTLAEGKVLHVDNNGDVLPMIIGAAGRGKVRWAGQTGAHTVLITECPELTRDVTCG